MSDSGRGEALRLLDVSRETAARLDVYADLLRQWQSRINLIAPSTLPNIWRRHILDSGQVAALAPPDAETWLDVGAGAGLPGLIVAILSMASKPPLRVTLVESNRKKTAFLAEAIRRTGAPAVVEPRRIEDVVVDAPIPFNVVSARALAPLTELLDMTAPVLMKGATGLFLKGQDVEAEIADAAREWTFDAERISSLSDPSGCVLRLRSLAPRAGK